MQLLSINDLSFSYHDQTVIDHVSLTIQEGEIFTLIGSNGCGKSTLLRLVSGLIDQQYDKNKILINDRPLASYQRKELARQIAVLPQGRNIPDISVQRLVEHGRFPYLDLSRRLTEKDKSTIENVLHTLKLNHIKDKNLQALSGGERQRAYVALTIAQDTPLILFDEPTTYLDINYQFDLLDTIQMLNRSYHKTIFMVLHDLNLALKYSDRIGVMDQGKLLFTGTPKELISTDLLADIFEVTCTEIIVDGKSEYIIRRTIRNNESN